MYSHRYVCGMHRPQYLNYALTNRQDDESGVSSCNWSFGWPYEVDTQRSAKFRFNEKVRAVAADTLSKSGDNADNSYAAGLLAQVS